MARLWSNRSPPLIVTAPIDEPDARRNYRADVVVAPVKLAAHLQLVIAGPQPGSEVADGRLGAGANDVRAAKGLRSPARNTCHLVEPARRRPVARARFVLPRIDESSDAHIPQGIRG